MGLMDAGGGLASGKLKLATAAENEVLSGETFYAGGKDLKTGSMPNHGAWGTTISPGGSVTIPQGYHNGAGKVTANKPTFHKKEIIASVNQWSGKLTYNVVSAFGIPSNIAGTLTANNFYGYIRRFSWSGGSNSDLGLTCNLSYNASSHVLTANYIGTNYSECTVKEVRICAFWAT